MIIGDCFNTEANALEKQFYGGEITIQEYNKAMRDLERDIQRFYDNLNRR